MSSSVKFSFFSASSNPLTKSSPDIANSVYGAFSTSCSVATTYSVSPLEFIVSKTSFPSSIGNFSTTFSSV